MGTFDLYSKRKRRERGEVSDVYTYDELPKAFRVQAIHILREALGLENATQAALDAVDEIIRVLRKERGVFKLAGQYNEGQEELFNYFLEEADAERALDVIELSFLLVDRSVRTEPWKYSCAASPDEAIAELNSRLMEAGIGYQYESGCIIRVDAQAIHAEVVIPALRLLSESGYEGADDEFRRGHEHYRAGRYKEAINECLKALESTLKTICSRRKWPIKPGDTAKHLITAALANGLLPPFLESQLSTFRSLLESGIPAVRNKTSGHGQGVEVAGVPQYLAGYVIHLTATTILMLAQAEQSMQ